MSKSKLLHIVLALFILSKGFVLLHDFSHYSIETTKEFNGQKKSHKSQDCLLCSFVNLQNHITPIVAKTFALSGFVVIFALRFFDVKKLSFLLLSRLSRAPPLFS